MAQPLIRQIRVYPDAESMSRAAAQGLVGAARARLDGTARFSLVLAGGGTPKRLYEILDRDFRDGLPWGRVDVFFGDERFVPHDSPDSNFGTARALFLDAVGATVYPVPIRGDDPSESAKAYEAILRSRFGGELPRFDLVLLGIGGDGHTASLFPGSPVLGERERWVAASESSVAPARRVTLTLPVINAASNVFFLVAGGEKAAVLARAAAETGSKSGREEPELPAAAVRPPDGNVVYWVDGAAAADLAGRAGDGVDIVRFPTPPGA